LPNSVIAKEISLHHCSSFGVVPLIPGLEQRVLNQACSLIRTLIRRKHR